MVAELMRLTGMYDLPYKMCEVVGYGEMAGEFLAVCENLDLGFHFSVAIEALHFYLSLPGFDAVAVLL